MRLQPTVGDLLFAVDQVHIIQQRPHLAESHQTFSGTHGEMLLGRPGIPTFSQAQESPSWECLNSSLGPLTLPVFVTESPGRFNSQGRSESILSSPLANES